MASRRQREAFDELLSRVILLLIGLCLCGIGGVTLQISAPTDTVAIAISGVLLFIGFPFALVGALGSKKTACSWAENSGNHEFLIVILIAAYGITWLIKKAFKST